MRFSVSFTLGVQVAMTVEIALHDPPEFEPGYGQTTMDLTGELGQIARRVEVLDRARGFFREKLGLRELYAFPGLAFFSLGQTRLMLREIGARDTADILYFRVPDIGAAHSALAARDVAFTSAPHVIHRHPDGAEEWMAFFHDDEGRDLSLHSVVPA